MRILFLTQVLPYPLDAGPKVRAYYVLRHLAESHEVTLLSFVRDTDTEEAVVHLAGYCDCVHTVPMPRGRLRDGLHLAHSIASGQPFIIRRDWTQSMVDQLTVVLSTEGPFDAIHADQLWMAPYALEARRLADKDTATATILDQHNAVYLIPERMSIGERNPLKRALLQREAQKLARFETSVCSEFDHVVWVTQEDYCAVKGQSTYPNTIPNSGIIPICVDITGEDLSRREGCRKRVTFLGGLHYPPNSEGICWFAEKVFPRVLQVCPEAVLTVIGKKPPERLSTLGIPEANLDVMGYVADPGPMLAETGAFIVPLHAGGGMRVKILDAWRWGVPVVSTTVGAEGIQYRNGTEIMVADAPEEFADGVCALMQDGAASLRMVEAAQRWVREKYDWRTIYRAWDTIYAEHGMME